MQDQKPPRRRPKKGDVLVPRTMLTGYWWEVVQIRKNQGSIKVRGKDFHEVSKEEYYDSLLD